MMALDEKLLREGENRLGCYCELQTDQKTYNYIDMDLTVGTRLWLNHYQVYLQTRTKIYLSKQFRDNIFRDCSKIVCYRHSPSPLPPADTPANKFTTLVTIDRERTVYDVSSEPAENVYVVSPFKGGIVKMVTEGSDGTREVYLLSEGQVVRVREFQNGSKEI